MSIDEPRIRGLRAVEQNRLTRQRALVMGRVTLEGDASRFWLWTFVIFIAFGIIYWKVAEGQLESQKSAVMSKQRAVAAVLGPKLLPFRERVEKWASELAHGTWKGNRVAPSIDLAALSRGPGVYLRVRQRDANDNEISAASLRSLHDGFTSCLFVRKEKADPAQGKACRSPSDCERGELCSEWNVCSPPTQPYNMRLAYRALRILSSEWTDELHAAANDIVVRVFERDLEKVSSEDVPIAIDLLARARFATIVLDEDPRGGIEAPKAEEVPPETLIQKLQRLPHQARVGIWDVGTSEPLALLRLPADAKVMALGNKVATDPEVERARQRQANSCALAVGVREAVDQARAPATTSPAAGTAEPGGPSASPEARDAEPPATPVHAASAAPPPAAPAAALPSRQ